MSTFLSVFQELYKAGEKYLGTDESVFNSIIALQSYEQLKLVFDEYAALTSHTIEQAINSEFSGDIQTGLLTIGKCACIDFETAE